MRTKLTLALAAVLAVALAGVALAVQTQTATITFGSQKANSATTIRSIFKVGDPTNTPQGKPSKHISRVSIQFPRGMKFNDNAYKQCATADKLRIRFACKGAIIGRGTTTVDGRGKTPGSGTGILKASLTAYNAKRGLRILVDIKKAPGLNQVLQPKLTRKNALDTRLPDALRVGGVELTNFNLLINPKPGKVKGKRTPYAVLPKTCPKGGGFVIKTKYYFQDFLTAAARGTFTTPGTANRCHK